MWQYIKRTCARLTQTDCSGVNGPELDKILDFMSAFSFFFGVKTNILLLIIIIYENMA